MSRSKSILAAAVLGAFAFVGAAQAATVTVTPVVTRYWPSQTVFNSDVNNGVTTSKTAIPAGNSAAGIYEIAFTVSTSLDPADTTAGFTGLGNLFFDAIAQGTSGLPAHLTAEQNFGAGLNDLALKYNNAGTKFQYTDPVTGTLVANGTGTTPGNNMFSTVADLGTAGDYKSYSFALGTGVYTATDPRLNVTQSGQAANLTNTGPTGDFTLGNPLKVAEIFVAYDGTGSTALTLSSNPATEGYGLHNNTTGSTTFFPSGTAGQTYSLGTLNFGVGTVPEPTSLALLTIGGLVASRRRRA